MNELESRVAELLPVVRDHGAVYLYALIEREDSKWDVVISSEWTDGKSREAIDSLAKQLVPKLSKEALSSLSRIVAMPSKAPEVTAFTSAMNVKGGRVEIANSNFFGLQIKHVILFYSERPPVAQILSKS